MDSSATPYFAMPTSPTGAAQPQHEPHPVTASSPTRVLTKQTSELTPQSVRLATTNLQRHTSMESSSPSKLKKQTKLHSPAHTFKPVPADEKATSPAKKIKKHLRQGFRVLSNAWYKDLREPEMQWKRVPAPPKDRRTDEPYNVWWVEDEDLVGCMICHVPFGMYFRRHHCRSCGDVVCSDCSKTRKEIYGLDRPHRVCDACMIDGTWVQPKRQGTTAGAAGNSEDHVQQLDGWVDFSDPLPAPSPETASTWGDPKDDQSSVSICAVAPTVLQIEPPPNPTTEFSISDVKDEAGPSWVADFGALESPADRESMDDELLSSTEEGEGKVVDGCCGLRSCCVIS